MPFPVVGVGASAGGLEALSELLANLPTNKLLEQIVRQKQAACSQPHYQPI
jgi:chemotaxis response regulator CheB